MMFDTVDNDFGASMYQRATILEFKHPESTKLEPKSCLDVNAKFEKDGKLNIKVDISQLHVNIDIDRFNLIVEENTIWTKLLTLKNFLMSEMRMCDEENFKKNERKLYYGNISEDQLFNTLEMLR